MKTKTIEVEIGYGEDIKRGDFVVLPHRIDKALGWKNIVKATLMVKVPEKKITISEVEFRQLYKDLCREAYTQKNSGDMWEPNKYMEYALKFEDQE